MEDNKLVHLEQLQYPPAGREEKVAKKHLTSKIVYATMTAVSDTAVIVLFRLLHLNYRADHS